MGPADDTILTELPQDIDQMFLRTHRSPPTKPGSKQATRDATPPRLSSRTGGRGAYGMLRGWDEGCFVPSLSIAVRTSAPGPGPGRAMMAHLHAEAGRPG